MGETERSANEITALREEIRAFEHVVPVLIRDKIREERERTDERAGHRDEHLQMVEERFNELEKRHADLRDRYDSLERRLAPVTKLLAAFGAVAIGGLALALWAKLPVVLNWLASKP